MLRLSDREQSYRSSADMLASSRWPATVSAFIMLSMVTVGFILGKEKLWPPSSFALGTACFCDCAVLSWIGRFDQRSRQKGNGVDRGEQKQYRFWKWNGTPPWLFALAMILTIVILVPLLIQPTYRIYTIAFIGIMALLTGYDYLQWRSRWGNGRSSEPPSTGSGA